MSTRKKDTWACLTCGLGGERKSSKAIKPLHAFVRHERKEAYRGGFSPWGVKSFLKDLRGSLLKDNSPGAEEWLGENWYTLSFQNLSLPRFGWAKGKDELTACNTENEKGGQLSHWGAPERGELVVTLAIYRRKRKPLRDPLFLIES